MKSKFKMAIKASKTGKLKRQGTTKLSRKTRSARVRPKVMTKEYLESIDWGSTKLYQKIGGAKSPKQSKSMKSLLSYNEILYYYKSSKDKTLCFSQGSEQLPTKCWQTLKTLMTQLLLKNEYNLLFESYKKKLRNLQRMKTLSHRDNDSQDTLIKLVLRCKQMHEAKEIVV